MPESQFLHHHAEFHDLIQIVGDNMGIDPVLVEKDYWIMHCLHGLQAMGLTFELKGGTSLSKGYGLIHRFSEDIDIRIAPPAAMDVKTGSNQDKEAHIRSRAEFYDWLAATIAIDGIVSVTRDRDFDDHKMRSGGIRLAYPTTGTPVEGLKDGILLELGFDDVTPNHPVTISAWAYDFAKDKIDIANNQAVDVACYDPGYTFVEKLQTISTKYRRQQESGTMPVNFMRHYYDVYCLLASDTVQSLIGSDAYHAHKARRFGRADNMVIADNPAFLLHEPATRQLYAASYLRTAPLYYREQPTFDAILERIAEHIDRL